jgi:hypothetical protein
MEQQGAKGNMLPLSIEIPSPQKTTIRHSLLAVHHSLIASRHSLPFRLGRSLALPFHPPTKVDGYRTKPAEAG